MDRHYQLKVTSPTTNIDVDSIDAAEVARIVQLAGISSAPQMPTAPQMPAAAQEMPPASVAMPEPEMPMDEQTCSICGASDHSEDECPDATITAQVAEMADDLDEVAEYDYGHVDQSGTGEQIDPDAYTWQYKRSEQHFGKAADNTMDDPINETAVSLYQSLAEAYRSYLSEAEHRENDDGIMSPLSDPDIEAFDKDPMRGETPVDDGSHSPMSTIKRQPALK